MNTENLWSIRGSTAAQEGLGNTSTSVQDLSQQCQNEDSILSPNIIVDHNLPIIPLARILGVVTV